jgi:hypothetical protein
MTAYTPISASLCEIIKLAKSPGGITLRQCLDLLGEKSILLVMLICALINSLPFSGIPGVSTITGIPITLLGISLIFSTDRTWLPKRVADYHLKPGRMLTLLERLVPFLRRLDRIIRQRLLVLSRPPVLNMIGGVIVIMGLMLALPLPLTNFPIGICLSLLAIGLITRDGVVIALGLALAAINGTVLVSAYQFLAEKLMG